MTALAGKIETAVKHGDEELADELRYRWSVERDRAEVRKAVNKGQEFVKLPGRGGVMNQVLIEWQRGPNRSPEEVADICGCARSVAYEARTLLFVAGVPGFAELKRLDPNAVRERRVRHAKKELARLATQRRRRQTLSLLRDRPDLTWSEVRDFTGVGWRVITDLVEEHDIPKRRRGRKCLTA